MSAHSFQEPATRSRALCDGNRARANAPSGPLALWQRIRLVVLRRYHAASDCEVGFGANGRARSASFPAAKSPWSDPGSSSSLFTLISDCIGSHGPRLLCGSLIDRAANEAAIRPSTRVAEMHNTDVVSRRRRTARRSLFVPAEQSSRDPQLSDPASQRQSRPMRLTSRNPPHSLARTRSLTPSSP